MRTGKSLTIYLPPELNARLNASAKRNHRTKTTQVILALEAFIAADEAASTKDPDPAPEAPKPKRKRKK